MATTSSEWISLRQWMRQALNSSAANNGDTIRAAASFAYRTASLTIALALTEQIGRAQKLEALGVSVEIERLPTSTGAVRDWSEFVWVRLKPRGVCRHGADASVVDPPWPYGNFAADGIAATPGADHENEELRALLESFDVDVFDAPSAVALDTADTLSYLGVESACIRTPESEANCISFNTDPRASNATLQRIYCLGLVFYELFSGGELPPPELVDLVSSDGAFVSLPTLTLTDNNDRHRHGNQGPLKRRQDPSGSSSNGLGLCQLSCEYLKLMGLPGPLCQLILNMLDCVYGDFRGDESYTNIDDVASDLRWMMDKPDKFLRDLDLEKLSVSGLEWNDCILPRDDELASITSCYHRCLSESYELAIIAGESGTGKSSLAQRVGEFIVARGGLFFTGKFDQMKQVSPFSALASAFDQYCDLLIKENHSEWAKQIGNKLKISLGRDACHLIKVIPKLKHILSCDSSYADSSRDQNCFNALQRLHYLLCQFVEAITTVSNVHVTLFLDDVQWADAASISVLHRLLLKRNKHFFFLGCCRDVEMADDHTFCDLMEKVHASGIKSTVVQLKCMEKKTLNHVLSDTLCLPPRVLTALSDIVYTKTKGNPLFVSQLMRSLNRDGLLRLSLSRQRWVWDIEEIQSMKLPEDVARCFANGISKLPLEVQSALRILSMFGASTKCEYIKALESQLGVKLIEPLNIAVNEGLVINLRGSFQFCHDCLQEASYALMEGQDRCRDHLRFGLCLVKLSLDTSDNDMLFTAVNQINFCGPSAVSDAQVRASMAKYNLTAGKSAMEMSDFSSAYSFFSFGIDFLPERHWTEHYHLSLELYDLASKSALATGNINSLRILVDAVLENARGFEDKLNIYFTIISSLTYASKISEALDKGCMILSQLGQDIPMNPSAEALDQCIQQTQSLIRGISENDILNFRLMTDKTKLMSMKFLAQLEIITLMVKPDLQPFVTLKMVQLTILYGLSPVSPIGFVYFGSLLAKRGNIKVGHRFTLLSKALLERLDARDVAGEVICVATEVLFFVEPLQAASKILIQGESAAMAGGDIHWACISRLEYCCIMFWSSRELSFVNEAFSEAFQFMREHQNKMSLFLLLPVWKTIVTLVESKTESLIDSELPRCIHENKIGRHLITISFHDLYRSFMFDNDMLSAYAEKFFLLKQKSWFLYFGDAAQAFISGLVAFQLYRKTLDSIWFERGKMCVADMKLWAEQGSSWNFHQHLLLLEAEELYSSGSFENAQASYENAIATSKSHKFLNVEALSCELAGKFYLGTGNLASSLELFRLAHENYHAWGALAKANQLFAFINEAFSDVFTDNSHKLSSTVNDSGDINLRGLDGIDSWRKRAV
ncbi:hypothetical protein ACHAW6_009383 [Cyclotella cf. meneghiniana]